MTIDRKIIYDDLPDAKHEAAHAYLRDTGMVEKLTGFTPDIEHRIYAAHIHGWEAAMEIRCAELLDENTELHARLLTMALEANAEEP